MREALAAAEGGFADGPEPQALYRAMREAAGASV